jgi:hypothetical protein
MFFEYMGCIASPLPTTCSLDLACARRSQQRACDSHVTWPQRRERVQEDNGKRVGGCESAGVVMMRRHDRDTRDRC